MNPLILIVLLLLLVGGGGFAVGGPERGPYYGVSGIGLVFLVLIVLIACGYRFPMLR